MSALWLAGTGKQRVGATCSAEDGELHAASSCPNCLYGSVPFRMSLVSLVKRCAHLAPAASVTYALGCAQASRATSSRNLIGAHWTLTKYQTIQIPYNYRTLAIGTGFHASLAAPSAGALRCSDGSTHYRAARQRNTVCARLTGGDICHTLPLALPIRHGLCG